MNRSRPLHFFTFLVLTVLALTPPGSGRADDDNAPSINSRLRDALKAANSQLQDAQAQVQTLQAAQADSAKQLATIKAQLDALTKQARADKKASDIEIFQLKAQLADAQRLVDDRERKNLELFQLANEILTRYEKFGLGDALSAKEPFTGLTRVKLENLVQGYQDKLLAQKARPGDVPSSDGNLPNGQPSPVANPPPADTKPVAKTNP